MKNLINAWGVAESTKNILMLVYHTSVWLHINDWNLESQIPLIKNPNAGK